MKTREDIGDMIKRFAAIAESKKDKKDDKPAKKIRMKEEKKPGKGKFCDHCGKDLKGITKHPLRDPKGTFCGDCAFGIMKQMVGEAKQEKKLSEAMMSRKDFIEFANLIKEYREGMPRGFVMDLVSILKRSNPAFDEGRFFAWIDKK